MKPFIETYHRTIIRLIVIIGIFLALFLLVAVCSEVKSYKYIGSGMPAADTITVQGHGSIDKSPDTAKFSFTIQDEEKDTASAQAVVSKKVDTVKSDLIAAGIDTKYISTDAYNSYPDYQTSSTIVPAIGMATSQSMKQQLKGYIVSQNVTVSVKDLTKTETIAGILGKDGVTSIDGPNLGFEDPHEVNNEARALAITDAQNQAQILAKSLGVSLVRIVSFSDNSGNGIAPVAYGMKSMAAIAPTAAPSIPTGVQTVTSDVSITYEIR